MGLRAQSAPGFPAPSFQERVNEMAKLRTRWRRGAFGRALKQIDMGRWIAAKRALVLAPELRNIDRIAYERFHENVRRAGWPRYA